jgi:putative endonuclease
MVEDRLYYVYILAKHQNGALYTGMTSDLPRRVHEHRSKAVPGHTRKYDITRLVWYETPPHPRQRLYARKAHQGLEARLEDPVDRKGQPTLGRPHPNPDVIPLPTPLLSEASLSPPTSKLPHTHLPHTPRCPGLDPGPSSLTAPPTPKLPAASVISRRRSTKSHLSPSFQHLLFSPAIPAPAHGGFTLP